MDHAPPIPANEQQRLVRIHDLCLIDDTPDEILDDIVALTAQHFEVPIALVSVVDQGRQWFRAKVGLATREMPRRDSFCAYAIHSDSLFQVCDATCDERFRDNPLVLGDPNIRFYAGMPLRTEDGLGLGSLCIIDNKPRPPLSEADTRLLASLARLTVTRLHELRRMTFIDLSTGLFNRTRLEEDVAVRLAAGEELLVVVADVLSPQFYNDFVKALGYRFDSELMLSIKQRLQTLLPEACQLYKISSIRFAFMLERPHLASAETLLQHIVEAFERPVECDRIPLRAQIGLGVLRLQPGRTNKVDWLRSATSAADDARAQGSGWAYYNSRLDYAQQRAFSLLSSLSEAVSAPDQLRLAFQPRVDLLTGECTSAEALLRWTHPFLGEISPAEFIPLAEKTALIRPLSLWVLAHAIEQAATWWAQGYRIRVSINVSATDLEDGTFADRLDSLLQQPGVDPRSLELEFTESALMRSPETVRRQLERISRLGVAIAIDDFGTGYSNWAYLRELPAGTVKLDQSFMCNLGTSEKDQRIVRTMIGLTSELGYRVVAEGIETRALYCQMQEWGCHEGQGYLIARPMPADALLDWLRSGWAY